MRGFAAATTSPLQPGSGLGDATAQWSFLARLLTFVPPMFIANVRLQVSHGRHNARTGHWHLAHFHAQPSLQTRPAETARAMLSI
jgi:hypothetical protein